METAKRKRLGFSIGPFFLLECSLPRTQKKRKYLLHRAYPPHHLHSGEIRIHAPRDELFLQRVFSSWLLTLSRFNSVWVNPMIFFRNHLKGHRQHGSLIQLCVQPQKLFDPLRASISLPLCTAQCLFRSASSRTIGVPSASRV